jgi:hypothetical protein
LERNGILLGRGRRRLTCLMTLSLPRMIIAASYRFVDSNHLTFLREYLVKNKYAAPGKVAINGGSNGGLRLLVVVRD